jgi:peroxiredoxin
MPQLSEGISAPDFELQTITGRRLRLLQNTASGPVVLAFYKSSCSASQLTFPYLQRIYGEAGRGSTAKLWAISQDDWDETQQFIESYGIGFDVLIDEYPYTVSAAYGLEFVPGIFVVDTDGVIQLSAYGFSKTTLSEVARILAEHGQLEAPDLFSPDDGLPATRPG